MANHQTFSFSKLFWEEKMIKWKGGNVRLIIPAIENMLMDFPLALLIYLNNTPASINNHALASSSFPPRIRGLTVVVPDENWGAVLESEGRGGGAVALPRLWVWCQRSAADSCMVAAQTGLDLGSDCLDSQSSARPTSSSVGDNGRTRQFRGWI